MKYVKGDILNAKHGIICHQVNCRLVMGSGLAKAIRDKYPTVYSEYRRVMEVVEAKHRLGKCQIVEVVPRTLYVANLFGQFNFGRARGVVYTDYSAVSSALKSLMDWHKINCHRDFPVYIPRGMSCGLAGGDWKVVEGIIKDVVPNAIVVRKI